MLGTTGSVFSKEIAGIGYVVTAQDRARADAAYQEGFAAYQGGDYPRALSLIQEADRLKPDQPDGWNLRGMVYLRLKKFDQAREAFTRAVALDPNLWAAQFNVAESWFRQPNYPVARKAFERLLNQTDRFKQGNRWELVQYKIVLCQLLGGDAKGAQARLSKLPSKGGATPARLYAEAAFAYQSKKPAEAQKSVAAALAAFPAPVNETFADSLVQLGWQASVPVVTPLPAGTASAAFAGGPGLPPGVVLATSPAPGMSAPMPYYAVDPKVEAAAAEPLPLPDAGVQPIIGKFNPALPSNPTAPFVQNNAPAPVKTAQATPRPEATPDIELEHKDLLMIE